MAAMLLIRKKHFYVVLVFSAVSYVVMLLVQSFWAKSDAFYRDEMSKFHEIVIKKASSKTKDNEYLLTFDDSKSLPHNYKQTRSHPNARFRQRSQLVYNLPRRISERKHLILFYNRPFWFDTSSCNLGVQQCPVTSCLCSHDPDDLSRADAVILDGVDLRLPSPPQKSSNQVWIFFGLEAPGNYHNDHYKSEKYRVMFNWTMTYRLDSDIPVPYGTLVRHNPPSDKDYTDIALRKSKSAVWIVSNCKTHSRREDYVQELRQFYDVDIYGKCGINCPSGNCLNRVKQDYRFYLAFENSMCGDYISEKLFNIYSTDIDLVPIVRGGADYATLIPAGTYINTATFPSPRQLADYLLYLENNVTAYTQILLQKDRYVHQGIMKSIYSGFCDICMKINNPKVSSNYYYDSVQWVEKDMCYPPNDVSEIQNV